MPAASKGSPPHVRGKPAGALGDGLTVGITPACAGKTSGNGFLCLLPRDHPRMCGENFIHIDASFMVTGSPPHVRGKRYSLSAGTCHNRITPACAGKTAGRCASFFVGEDHPRMCGENSIASPAIPAQPGSPPHVRGKLQCKTGTRLLLRITPACAGKTIGADSLASYREDHPRMCGENPSLPLRIPTL